MGNHPCRDSENQMIYLTTPIGLTKCSRDSLTDPVVESFLNRDLIFCLQTEDGADCILTDKKNLLNGHWHSPLLVPDASALESLATSDERIARLLEIQSENQPENTRNKLLSLIFYFSFNNVPSSSTLIQRWLTDAGIEASEVLFLAEAVSGIRTGLSESTHEKVEYYLKLMVEQASADPDKGRGIEPGYLDEAFSLPGVNYGLMPCFDRYSGNDSPGEGYCFYADQIAETSMLIEDHACIVAGLSISVTQLARMTESAYPLFFNNLLKTIIISERDILSLGRLLHEYPDLFSVLSDQYKVRLHLISVNREHTYYATEFIPGKGFSASLIPDALPVFLRLTK